MASADASAAPAARSEADADTALPQQHGSLWRYRGARYFKLVLALSALSVLLYLWHDPMEGKSGSTWLGYGLGSLGAAMIIGLAWLGVRKRQFVRGRARVQGWVSAHVYLGLALTLVVTLHTGFQLGWNIHSLAYVLMLLVVVSGIYGVLALRLLPAQISQNRDGATLAAWLAEVKQLNNSALALADQIDPETHTIIARSIAQARIGGGAWAQLSGRYQQAQEPLPFAKFVERKQLQLHSDALAQAQTQTGRSDRQATIAFIADQIFTSGSARGGEGDDRAAQALQKLLPIIAKRKTVLERINRDITLRARQAVWLYVHVPLTLALLAALLAHILSVFLYW